MGPSPDLRQTYLMSVCRALTTYVEEDHALRLKTVHDGDSLDELMDELRGKSTIVFTIESWEAFRNLLEPDSARLQQATSSEDRCRTQQRLR